MKLVKITERNENVTYLNPDKIIKLNESYSSNGDSKTSVLLVEYDDYEEYDLSISAFLAALRRVK
jgi:hypothetical protein